jgi:DNA-binding CsgD family transcriptional regulator
MEDNCKRLLFARFLDLLNEIPVAASLFVDKKGSWDLRDFERVWANKASEALFPHAALRTFVDTPIQKNKINTMQAFWNHAKRSIGDGVSGFIGPFCNHFINDDMSMIVIEHHILYLGETEDGCPAFFEVVFDKTTLECKSKMAKANDTDATWNIMSNRERHVAQLVCKKLSTKEIADKLGVSERTIDNHRANIRKKLGLPRNVALIKYLGINLAP